VDSRRGIRYSGVNKRRLRRGFHLEINLGENTFEFALGAECPTISNANEYIQPRAAIVDRRHRRALVPFFVVCDEIVAAVGLLRPSELSC